MNIFIYSELQKYIEKSGVGRAIYHQKKSAQLNGINCIDNLKQADAVHINTVFIKSLFIALSAKRKKIPVIYHAHSTQEDFRNSFVGSDLLSGLFRHWLKLCYNCADVIVTPTEYSKQLLQSYGIKKEIYAVSNGIDISDYVRNEQAGICFREKYGYKSNDKIIMSAGLLIKRKGILDFVSLARKMPDYQFIWFGSGNLLSAGKAVRTAVKEKIPNLRFAGYVKKDELKAAYSGCDLFLFPSFEETEGIVVLEALAMKIPVLLRNIPVYADWLTNGLQVYKGSNSEEFEYLINAVLSGKLPDITENGYKCALNRSLDITGAELAKIYTKCIAAKNASSLICQN